MATRTRPVPSDLRARAVSLALASYPSPRHSNSAGRNGSGLVDSSAFRRPVSCPSRLARFTRPFYRVRRLPQTTSPTPRPHPVTRRHFVSRPGAGHREDDVLQVTRASPYPVCFLRRVFNHALKSNRTVRAISARTPNASTVSLQAVYILPWSFTPPTFPIKASSVIYTLGKIILGYFFSPLIKHRGVAIASAYITPSVKIIVWE